MSSVTSLGALALLLTSFRGRISRLPWWIGFVFWFLGNLSGALLFNPGYFTAEELPPPNWPDTTWQLAWLVPLSAITKKRFNDRDWPSWLGYAFVALNVVYYVLPHFGLLISPEATGSGRIVFWITAALLLAVFIDNGFFRGTHGANRYGPDPLNKTTPGQPT